jgi:uncharacterized Fe-S cluster-containing radical SAM superfamily protein
MLFDPLQLTEDMEKIVVQGELRKYYRISRPGRWYGGIASADCCGCNLRCIFCWSGAPRDNPERMGKFYSAQQIFESLKACADKCGYELLRISGNEPTIGKEHLLKLLELIEKTSYKFILETNGILIGHDANYARKLSSFRCVHVRVSIKGTNREEFSRLTGSVPEAFDLQLRALENLIDDGVSCHPAVMLSFSPEDNFNKFVNRVREIDQRLADDIEKEYVFMYPHVSMRLRMAGIRPIVAYEPGRVPKDLI